VTHNASPVSGDLDAVAATAAAAHTGLADQGEGFANAVERYVLPLTRAPIGG
jgi:hypothetical protein